MIDPAKKAKYDSALPFDDKIPKMENMENDADFYEKFSMCFTNNARFSKITPTPPFGDGKTDIVVVRRFYDFWEDFKTWREFA